jgi:hypothetical protein
MEEALEALSAEIERVRPVSAATRVYTPNISPNVLVFETVYEDEAAHHAFWDAYDSDSPEAAPFWTKWREVTERSVGTDRWDLAEWR